LQSGLVISMAIYDAGYCVIHVSKVSEAMEQQGVRGYAHARYVTLFTVYSNGHVLYYDLLAYAPVSGAW